MYNRAANVYRQVNASSSPPTRILDELYAGLLQENMALFDDQVGGTWIELAY